MNGKILKKRYYQITFRLMSPLAIGSGESVRADKDVICDAQGVPYIPASAIAGVTRNALTGILKEKEIQQYYGDVEIATTAGQETNASESRLVFYDGVLKNREFHISVRDSVSLDAYKTAKDGAKFDMEVLEPGAEFVTLLEQGFFSEQDEVVSNLIAGLFHDGKVRFGAKSMRGYGETGRALVRMAEFDLTSDTGVEAWLQFDPFREDAWNGKAECTFSSGEEAREGILSLSLKQCGGISVRKYTTKVSTGNKPQPDMEQLTVRFGREEKPTIPGTSWAGAFRHRMGELGLEREEDEVLFGFVRGEGKNGKQRSRIRFSETVIDKAHEKVLSRTAINRFDGGVKNGALFTEKTYYDGELTLNIGLDKKDRPGDGTLSILAAAVTDLHYGFLAIGGETSIGRGLFEITSVNGKRVEDGTDIYTLVLDTLREVMCA